MLKNLSPLAKSTLSKQCIALITSRSISHRSGSVWEPDYLESLKPKFPQYQSLNVQIKGYDYPVLENYQRYLHSIADYLDIDVADCYALPPQHTQVQRLRPSSNIVDAEYKLTMFERNMQLTDVNAPTYPIFLRVAQASLPEGVQLHVEEHTDECEERRYVPDRDLLDLKSQLEQIQSGNTTGKKK